MALLAPALDTTLRWEGGYTVDTGGRTKYGISQNAYPNLDIPNLTIEQAREIYRRDYWAPIMGDGIKSQELASVLFDFAVNAGIGRAIRELQQAINEQGGRVTVDGGMGPQTLAAANRLPGANLANALTARRVAFYRNLAESNPAKYGQYLKGWLKRAESFFFEAAPVAGGGLLLLLAGGIAALIWYRRRKKKG